MHWDYLKRWTNFRRQLSKRHVTPKISFSQELRNHANFTRNRFSVILCCFIDIFLAFILSMQALFKPKAYFHFLNVNFSLSAFYELWKSTATLSTSFTLYDVWNAFWQCFSPFELRSCHLRSFSDVKRYNDMLICVYCKLESHTRLK